VNLILNVPPETEEMLREAAAQSGKAPETFALEALNEKLAGSVETQQNRSREAWLEEYRAWISSHPVSETIVLDDSRDSIYEGCGE
jgi:hypothetical protein